MWLRRIAVTALVTTALTIGGAATAMAYAPVNIVHTERVQAGPYG
jgi:chromate transport protein ChrA